MPRPLSSPRALLAALLVVVAAAMVVATAGAQTEDGLRNSIESKRAQEQNLASAAARLGRLERRATREVNILQTRLNAAQTELNEAQAQLDQTRADLRKARGRALRLRARLTDVRKKLGKSLAERYKTGRPDLVTVLVQADGFSQLLERFRFLRQIEKRDTSLLELVKDSRKEAVTERRKLTKLEAARETEAEGVLARRDALAKVSAALERRRAALSQARAARVQALQGTRASRRNAEKTLNKLVAERQKAARQVGPGGPWSIPWPIVECESGGQNLPPNHAGASGYYQFMPATWKGLGGSTPNAYQAPKAEQDRLAAQLWNNGAGASNWVCAGLVGDF